MNYLSVKVWFEIPDLPFLIQLEKGTEKLYEQ